MSVELCLFSSNKFKVQHLLEIIRSLANLRKQMCVAAHGVYCHKFLPVQVRPWRLKVTSLRAPCGSEALTYRLFAGKKLKNVRQPNIDYCRCSAVSVLTPMMFRVDVAIPSSM